MILDQFILTKRKLINTIFIQVDLSGLFVVFRLSFTKNEYFESYLVSIITCENINTL